MVKIAFVGGSGRIASEIVDVLAATKKHEIIILSRRESTAEKVPGITWIKADYTDKAGLISIFGGVHTVLSFVTAHDDPGSVTQKLLIDAAIEAGVKRFAPSEWGSSTIEELPWYAEKANVREYLKEVNKDKKALEYTLFQPGLLADFFIPEGTTTKRFKETELYVDFFNRRALTIEGKDGFFSITTMKDIANIVARAIEYDGEWPVIGGIHGRTLSDANLIEIGVKARGGKPWDVTALKEEDVRAGDFKSSWIPVYKHPDQSPEQIESMSKIIAIGCLLSGVKKSWVVSDEWNRLLPDYEFADIDEILCKYWGGK